MLRVRWPELDLELSQLAFGCAPVMGRVGKREALSAMAQAYEQGVTHFDVARAYGFGEAERVLGRFIADKRDRVTIATKFGIQPARLSRAARLLKPAVRMARARIPGVAAAVKRTSATMLTKGYYGLDDARASLEQSLRELRCEAVDVLFVHECSESDEVSSALLAFLEELKRAGKIKAWGLATHAEQMPGVAGKLGSAPQVSQFPCGGALPASWSGVRRIVHGPMSYAASLLPAGMPVPPALTSWARSHGMTESEFRAAFPKLVLQALVTETPESVLLCSMFSGRHIAENAQAVSQAVLAQVPGLAELAVAALRQQPVAGAVQLAG